MGAKFGAFTVEEWRPEPGFYGCGVDMFLFKLQQTEAKDGKPAETEGVDAYECTFLNNQYQASNHRSLFIGSGENGRASLFITNGFRGGYTSDNCETFHHPLLSAKPDFEVSKFEAWGFDFI